MDMTMRPATPTERLYANEQRMEIVERCGNPGYLWGKLDNSGSIFINSLETFVAPQSTPEFKAEFNTVLDMLRFDEWYGHVLKNRATMIVYCLDHSQGSFRNGYKYAFRADTQDYSYLIRCTPAGEDNHVHIYPHRWDCLDRAQALAIVDECNEIGGVSKTQAAAMLAGSMFGWHIPGADPKNYDEQGKPIKPKQHSRDDAR